MTKTVIQHVLSRLSDIGVKDVFGVPGNLVAIIKPCIRLTRHLSGPSCFCHSFFRCLGETDEQQPKRKSPANIIFLFRWSLIDVEEPTLPTSKCVIPARSRLPRRLPHPEK